MQITSDARIRQSLLANLRKNPCKMGSYQRFGAPKNNDHGRAGARTNIEVASYLLEHSLISS
jgi:hypothetical protein